MLVAIMFKVVQVYKSQTNARFHRPVTSQTRDFVAVVRARFCRRYPGSPSSMSSLRPPPAVYRD